MNKELRSTTILFWGRLFLFLFPSYWLHQYVYTKFDISIDYHLLQLSYLINGLLAALIFSVLMFLKKKYNDQLGFLYMLGSFFKFGAYFLIFHSEFKADGVITKIEFSVFFIPYLISLLIETLELIKVLNSKDNKES